MNNRSSQAITQWLIQRSSAILILSSIILAPFSLVLFAISIFTLAHLYLGLEEILSDYVHNEVIVELFLSMLRIFIIISFKYVLVLLVIL